jgi:hypothetical protein
MIERPRSVLRAQLSLLLLPCYLMKVAVVGWLKGKVAQRDRSLSTYEWAETLC